MAKLETMANDIQGHNSEHQEQNSCAHIPRKLPAYYKRDFHPAKRDSTFLRKQGLKKLSRMLDRSDLAG